MNNIRSDVNTSRRSHGFTDYPAAIPVGGLDICIGEEARPDPRAKRVVLFGDCAIKHNQDFEGAKVFHGCPPDMAEYLKFLMESNLPPFQAKKQLAVRVCKMIAFKLGLFKEDYGYWEPHQSSEFDMNLYR